MTTYHPASTFYAESYYLGSQGPGLGLELSNLHLGGLGVDVMAFRIL